jgi:dsRNA-specific ribonuclease
MEDNRWKRARDEIAAADPSPTPSKKRKSSAEKSDSDALVGLTQLHAGLAYVEAAHGLSEETKQLAQKLRDAVSHSPYTASTASSTPKENGTVQSGQNDQNDDQNDQNGHTDVPPPFPMVPMVSTNVTIPGISDLPPPSSSCRLKSLPPLPPITELTLLTAPFTHTATLPHYVVASGENTYEHLEFLGDAYLEIIATRMIHKRFATHSVGQKSGLREILIRNDTLSQYSREYGFGERVKTGANEREHGGKTWMKILADVFEAYVAAIILSDGDAGFSIAERWLTELWAPKVQEWLEKGDGNQTALQEHANHDVKSELQRLLVSKGVKLEYLEEKPMELVKEGNRTTFFMGVYLTGWGYDKVKLGTGSGRSKQLAGSEAARSAFETNYGLIQVAHQKKIAFDRINKSRKAGG